MISISELLSSLPTSKKLSYFNNIYYQGIVNFLKNNSLDDELTIDSLIERQFHFIIKNDRFINDIKLFPNKFILEITHCSDENGLKKLPVKKIREQIKKYFNITDPATEVFQKNICSQSCCQFALHPFQERMRRRVINLIYNNQKRFLIHMPTGAGKTRTAVEIIIDFIRLSASKALLVENFKILWIAQSNELCFQAYETFKSLYDLKGTQNINIEHFYGDNALSENVLDKPGIIFCSIQKLLLHYKKDVWASIKQNNYLIVVDEAHRSVATKWKICLDYFSNNSSTYLLGLTATPGSGSLEDTSSGYTVANYYHNNKLTITNEKFQDIVRPIEYLTNEGFLANIERIDINSNYIVNDQIAYRDFEFSFKKETLLQLSVNKYRNKSIIEVIKKHATSTQNNKIIVFTCGMEHNKILQELLYIYNIQSEFIDAETRNRDTLINDFKHGNLNVLLNFGVLTTGFDAPKTNVCIIARPISSIVMYSQMVGRILRGPQNNGNKNNYLYTIKDNFNHGDYDEMFNTFNEFYK